MILPLILCALSPVLSRSVGPSIQLGRKFRVGTTERYQVRASLAAEEKTRGLQTAIPEDLDLNYDFSVTVKSLGTDGIAKVIYDRPTFTTIEGETFDAPPKTKIEKLGLKFELTVSPINEILAQVDLSPKKKTSISPVSRVHSKFLRLKKTHDVIGQYVGEIERLSLFVGSFESSLDFNPRLPFDEVKVGDTWKRTVGYSPQKLKGKDGKLAVQRLDYVLTYKGLIQSEGKMVQRVEAVLNLDTDLGTFINQNLETGSEETGIKSIPLKLQASIQFDLDQKFGSTILAQAISKGGFSIILTDEPDDPVASVSLKGRTVMRLLPQSVQKK